VESDYINMLRRNFFRRLTFLKKQKEKMGISVARGIRTHCYYTQAYLCNLIS